MPIAIAGVPGTKPSVTDNSRAENKQTQVGDWSVHSWGNAKVPGMAAVSAIATLHLSATLSELPVDRIAFNNAAEYLTKALASQIKSFQESLVL